MVICDLARNPWLWLWSTALRLGAATLDSFEEFLSSGHSDARPLEPAWTTSRQTLLDLPASRVHEFAGGAGFPVILIAPFALHGPVLADLAPSNSLVERLLTDRVGRVLLLECKSASSETRLLGIDDYLAALLVAVEELGRRAALVGLCQGGWLSLMFAARFPRRCRGCSLRDRLSISTRRPRTSYRPRGPRLPRWFKRSSKAMMGCCGDGHCRRSAGRDTPAGSGRAISGVACLNGGLAWPVLCPGCGRPVPRQQTREALVGFRGAGLGHTTKAATSAPSRALPRRRALCTYWKKPR